MTILIGYVPTPEGEAALDAGLREAGLRGEDAVILNSPRRGVPVDGSLLDSAASSTLIQRAKDAGVTATVDQAEHGSHLVDTFVSLAEKHSVTLAVIGLRRRTPVGKLVMGSNAQRLLLELPVPVLAVKPS
ncbi:universal stress protein [Nocardioides sp. CFH 31398]|uniref:universal stress protein n=1 Tax=Nocardioides sp. CFH 31398 TaxID=2919579 RepID=UPI001F069C09|nr:universal stress protein [Nocardioides sp. CFH 31398]MCH1868780.1 universal stress protein [Nocardioides sp. CFH 31398]